MAADLSDRDSELRDVAHRLRNELHAISLAGVLINELCKGDAELSSVADGITHACARARQLTETLLAVADATEHNEL